MAATPLIVIVGRPNVGKSTLFNRLCKNHDAIVDNQSGVTRDRNYGEADWAGKVYRVIDTGGFVPDSPDLFETAIREQIDIAIEEAHKIIFVVDSRDGVTPVDLEFAQKLRSVKKQVLIAVNKVDSENFDAYASEFYTLGLGEPYPISALSGRRLGDFLDVLLEDYDMPEEVLPDERLKIAIVGRPNAGKSSLTNALLGYDRSIVTDIPGTTRDSIDSVLKYYGEEIVLIDTAGLRKKARVKESIEFYSTIRTLKAISECDVAIVMIDAVQGLEKQDQKIIDEAIQRKKGVILAINKWDLVEKDTNTAVKLEKAMKEKLGTLSYLPVIFISALTKQRIFKLVDLAKSVQAERSKVIPTSQLNDYLLEKIQATPPATTPTGKEVKIKYITQATGRYPLFLFFSNYPSHIQDSYRRYLERLLREEYVFNGVPLTLVFKEK